MKRILFIVGSFRQKSFNLQLAHKAMSILTDMGHDVRILEYKDLPPMNQDNESPEPASVARVRQEVMTADAIWIFTPEYNASYPGMLKNLIDWLSRPIPGDNAAAKTAIGAKKVCVSGVGGKSATAHCRAKLSELLTFVRADLMQEPQTGIALGAEDYRSERLTLTTPLQEALKQQAEALLAFIS